MLLETLSGAKPSLERAEQRQVREEGEESHEAEEEEADGEAAEFCTAWLSCVGSATVGCLLAKVRHVTSRHVTARRAYWLCMSPHAQSVLLPVRETFCACSMDTYLNSPVAPPALLPYWHPSHAVPWRHPSLCVLFSSVALLQILSLPQPSNKTKHNILCMQHAACMESLLSVFSCRRLPPMLAVRTCGQPTPNERPVAITPSMVVSLVCSRSCHCRD